MDYEILEADDNTLGSKIGKGMGIVLFFASWCSHSRVALEKVLPKLGKEFGHKLSLIAVPISVEEADGLRKIKSPTIKECLGITRYPQYAVFSNGLLDLNLVISEKDEEGQYNDAKELLRRIEIE